MSYGSKYDFVKVRVWLSECHHYVLSRFLVSRFLTSTMVKRTHALRIALELKKQLVDKERLDVSQIDIETVLFNIMLLYGYDDEYISRFKMMSAFHNQRTSLVILIAGTGCIGKSVLARQLAERLNLTSILQTDLVYRLVSQDSRRLKDIEDFSARCGIVKHFISANVGKCVSDGKSLIVEGNALRLKDYVDFTGIIIPFLVVLEDTSLHTQFIENSFHSTNTEVNLYRESYISLQQHLIDTTDANIPRIRISASSTSDALDSMHKIVLDRMLSHFQEHSIFYDVK